MKALVLGMAFHTKEHATEPTAVRDRARLLALESLGYEVTSMNREFEHVEEGKHVTGYFGKRIVKAIFQKFDIILLDYFRFPKGYLITVYKPFLLHMLPELVQAKVIRVDTPIYLPNDRELAAILPQTISCQCVKAAENPLYRATDEIKDTELLGGYKNNDELRSLHAEFPFLKIVYDGQGQQKTGWLMSSPKKKKQIKPKPSQSMIMQIATLHIG